MALNLNAWNRLPADQKNEVVNFLRDNCKIDNEYPDRSATPSSGGYPISEGFTSGGHPMKYGEEYRIYLHDIRGIPAFLDSELRERHTRKRIGGSEAIKAIMQYGGLAVGYN